MKGGKAGRKRRTTVAPASPARVKGPSRAGARPPNTPPRKGSRKKTFGAVQRADER
jgi:hypothetical protein